ncbi:phospholipase [Anaeromyxobacter diazotrophicus]|uniref:Phospholipase n=1 Tax=Anaeromyxobacter diazotrophicus TaxID=2590199 RepID=A0A7I9VN48_9BACT|nr:phospholipase [Anaeromyxobacter diazotrophicus]GEJ57407.1 hypothetical protein AMYX_21480 [Anaeromyxobacter diazotrophicus]
MPFALALLLALPALARAWDGHAALTWAALSGEPAVAAAAPTVAEPVEAFLAAEGEGLAALLEAEEAWARAHVPRYPPRPEALRFDPRGDPATARVRFLEALRVNPALPLTPHVQELPGQAGGGRPELAWPSVGTLPTPPHPGRLVFRALRAGEPVPPLEVVASASDEPDHGLDVGLFEDSGTPFGARYGYGKAPFGDPRLPFATQAPFHMGFFHEARLLTLLAPALARTFPEVRLHAFASLARFAFARGHAYWGWRFLGFGLHYAQDLTQPYHATVSPGTSALELAAVSALDAAGVHGPRQRRLERLSDLHLALEAEQGEGVWRALAAGDGADPLLAALRDRSRDAALGPYDDAAPRARLSAVANGKAARTAAALEAALAPGAPPARRAALEAVLADLLRDCGAATRSYARAALEPRPAS